MVVVICLEGCHGSGKSSLTKTFEAMGIETIDEGFMNMPSTLLKPQSLLMETQWCCSWFLRLLDLVKEGPSRSASRVIIADRSPLSAVLYALQGGALLDPVIRTMAKEVSEAAGVHVVTVHLRTQRELLWRRVQERLEREPHRLQLREDDPSWLETVLNFYDATQWDLTVANDERPLHELAHAVLAAVGALPAPVGPAMGATVERAARYAAVVGSAAVPKQLPLRSAGAASAGSETDALAAGARAGAAARCDEDDDAMDATASRYSSSCAGASAAGCATPAPPALAGKAGRSALNGYAHVPAGSPGYVGAEGV